MSRITLLLLVVALLGMTFGCQKGDDRPATYAVTGTVTQGGTPVEGAMVNFSPTGDGQAASGTTDASGKYSLTTFAAGDGAVPGEYAVTVLKYEGGGQATDSGGTDTLDEYDAEYSPEEEDKGGGDEEPENLLPSKYADPSTSELKATVTQNPADNVFDFALEG
jgi:hypothetical protein